MYHFQTANDNLNVTTNAHCLNKSATKSKLPGRTFAAVK